MADNENQQYFPTGISKDTLQGIARKTMLTEHKMRI